VSELADKIMQLLAPFGWRVSVHGNHAMPDMVVYQCDLVVRNPASHLDGERLNYSFPVTRHDLMLARANPDRMNYLAMARSHQILSETLILIQQKTAAPAPPPPADDDPQPFVVGER
jgi:hypothetical protein